MSDFLNLVATFFMTALGWLGSVLNTVTSNPPLLVLVLAMPICGFAVGLLRRIIRL